VYKIEAQRGFARVCIEYAGEGLIVLAPKLDGFMTGESFPLLPASGWGKQSREEKKKYVETESIE
jgi:hypothetical protein